MPPPADKPPASHITSEQVRDVACLSRLSVDDSRLPRLTAQLESILHHIAKVSEVDVREIEPMAHAGKGHNVLRDDVAEAALPLEMVLRNAPDTDGPFFKVPKVIGGDEDSAG